MKERLNYIKTENYYVGAPVNIQGVVIQAESLDELTHKGKVLCKIMLDELSDIINQEDPFELKEMNREEWRHHTIQPSLLTLIKKQNEYIELLDRELSKTHSIAHIRGYKAEQSDIELGEQLRESIKKLKSNFEL
jgi:predicted RNase H-like HicB family nuclease